MRNKVYISGKMSGRSVDEYTAHFNKAEAMLKEDGFKVMNPARWGWFLRHLPYRFALAFDLFMMCFCYRVYMLEGWVESNGANVEHKFAWATGMIITYEK